MDYDKILSKKVKDIPFSGIRKFFDIAASYKDVISLSVGEPDFKTPWAIRKEAIKTLEKGKTTYTANAGLEQLRNAISDYLLNRVETRYDPKKELIVTVGGSEAIDLAVRAIVDIGDEVLIPEPSFVCYSPIVSLANGVPIPIETKVENNFKLTPEQLKAHITPKTKLLILPYPNNPTGAVMRKEDLEAIAEVLRGTDIMVLSDEIYSELTYGAQKHISIVQIEGMKERTILINGFSKAFSMTGWRLGFSAAPEAVTKQMLKIHQYGIMSSPSVSQYAAITALTECAEDVARMRDEYDLRRRLIVKGFNDLGLECFEPEGAFYIFPSIKSTGLSSQEFCERLIESHRVAVVPGDAFGKCGEGFIRVSYAYSLNHINTALERIGEFLKELRNDNKA
ncbi:MAG: aminotransferase class I/II-fold pyridoxal phosphate-dependent enzyme [Ruminiclostridium sp.]|nr:aminotransferase class I/II-fold pyridoxal phosphate-dependent enzyme [Ruminiclostridium sp.]